jgi:hypothetical protein
LTLQCGSGYEWIEVEHFGKQLGTNLSSHK